MIVCWRESRFYLLCRLFYLLVTKWVREWWDRKTSYLLCSIFIRISICGRFSWHNNVTFWLEPYAWTKSNRFDWSNHRTIRVVFGYYKSKVDACRGYIIGWVQGWITLYWVFQLHPCCCNSPLFGWTCTPLHCLCIKLYGYVYVPSKTFTWVSIKENWSVF